MNDSMNKTKFLDIMRTERKQWEALLSEVGIARMEIPGAAGEWSVKDIIAHITAYEQGLVEWLRAASCGETVEFPILDHPDLDYRNQLIYSVNRSRTLEEVLQESEEVFHELSQLVASLLEEELLDPDKTAWFVIGRWKEARPLWKCIADDSYEHYKQHVEGVREWLNRIDRSK
jgi:hypothetical protein